jgi:hypothetical protein
MTQRRSKKPDAADVLPPEGATPKAKSADSRKSSDENLRMPPLIDHGEDGVWAPAKTALGVSLYSVVWGAIYKVTSALHQMGYSLLTGLRHLLYRLSLLALIGATLGLAGFALFQARDLTLPDIGLPEVTSFWQAPPATNPEREVAPAEPLGLDAMAAAPETPPYIKTPHYIETPADIEDKAVAAPRARLEILETDSAPALEAERGAHAATRQALAQAQLAASALEPRTREATKAMEVLQHRADMAELLVRLQNGWAFAELLQTQNAPQEGLSARQISALALHAEAGVPTQANLAGQAKGLWQAQVETPSNIATPEETAPPQTNEAQSEEQMPAFLSWLRARAGGLVAVQAAPQDISLVSRAPIGEARPSDDLRQIYHYILAGDYEAASTKTRTAILRLDALVAAPSRTSQIESLQALYADLRALQEVTPIVHQLREQFLASAPRRAKAGGSL